MGVLSKQKIEELLLHGEQNKRLIITPILDKEKQMGSCTVDLRLGTRFKVDLRTRSSYIDPEDIQRPIATYFDETYREFGEKFLIYPGQLVVASTFEYVRMPNNCFGHLNSRSSWNRLGINLSSVIQPGYAGVLTLELMNNSSNPIAVYPGLRIVQLSIELIEEHTDIGYVSHAASKYIANAEPHVSNISDDEDFSILKRYKER